MTQHDQLHRYLFENYAVRGELVTVSETLEQILANHTYPQPVKTVLAELLVATSLLTATLKFAGDITVQLQGDGPLQLAVINGNNQQQLRGVARVQGEIADDADLKAMVGNGYLVITISRKRVSVIRRGRSRRRYAGRLPGRLLPAFRAAADAPYYPHRRT